MFYIDTSVLAAYYCPEPLSLKVEKFLNKKTPVISSLSEVELYSALSKKVRMKELHIQDSSRVMNLFQSHIEDGFFERMPLESRHYALARDWIGQMKVPLRTLDALHLALASITNFRLVTADQGLAKAARFYQVKVQLLQ